MFATKKGSASGYKMILDEQVPPQILDALQVPKDLIDNSLNALGLGCLDAEDMCRIMAHLGNVVPRASANYGRARDDWDSFDGRTSPSGTESSGKKSSNKPGSGSIRSLRCLSLFTGNLHFFHARRGARLKLGALEPAFAPVVKYGPRAEAVIVGSAPDTFENDAGVLHVQHPSGLLIDNVTNTAKDAVNASAVAQHL